jgi:hypothetical protein
VTVTVTVTVNFKLTVNHPTRARHSEAQAHWQPEWQ